MGREGLAGWLICIYRRLGWAPLLRCLLAASTTAAAATQNRARPSRSTGGACGASRGPGALQPSVSPQLLLLGCILQRLHACLCSRRHAGTPHIGALICPRLC